MSKLVTEEWKSIVWRPLGKGFKLIFLLFVLLPVAGVVSAFMLSVYLTLGLLWLLSLGNITLVKDWNSYLEKNWKTTIGKKVYSFVNRTLTSIFGEV